MHLKQIVEKTYGVDQLAGKLSDSLVNAGCDMDRLTPADLIAFDELHVMGRMATEKLGALVGLTPRTKVLDIGCGVGGPARTLAARFGCQVVGVDLAWSFIEAAAMLSRQVGLAHRVSFQCADAMCLPFADQTFDTVFLLHVTMNILDKQALLAEMHRVIKDGGLLALWEICKGPNPEVIYPVSWADDASFSHLLTFAEMKSLCGQGAFDVIHWEDATLEALHWVRARMQPKKANKPSSPRPRPDLDLLMANFRLKRQNIGRNLAQGGIAVLRAMGVKLPLGC
jgi:ubiquinone/menaquinone biosynthesis C-methylase UbiE